MSNVSSSNLPTGETTFRMRAEQLVDRRTTFIHVVVLLLAKS